MLFTPVFQALDVAGVRYVVVGGLAVVLHGHARLTADLDLMIDLAPEAAAAAIRALMGLGFRPNAPVDPLDFARPEVRSRWAREKGMRVFSLWDPGNPMRTVDLFVENPLNFEEAWGRSEAMALGGATVRVAAIPDLIRLKRSAGRPQDLDDIERLQEIQRLRGPRT